jgi:hypothetical protein
LVPWFPVKTGSVLPVLVIADVPIGLFVFQVNEMLQVLLAEGMIQLFDDVDSDPVGSGVTMITILSFVVPPSPIHLTVYVVLVVRFGVTYDPVVPVLVVVKSEQELALVLVHERVVFVL